MNFHRKTLLTLLALVPPVTLYLSISNIWPKRELHLPHFKVVKAHPFNTDRPVTRLWRLPQAEPEVRQVVFAKIHKAASSTVQNILLRFAVFRDLNVLLADRQLHLNERDGTIKKIIPHPEGEGKPFDILCSHFNYNASEIARFFPDSAARVAILREPLKQSVSALAYYSTKYPSKILKGGLRKYSTDPINGFLRHPEDFYDFNKSATYSYLNNRMSVDLGFDLKSFEAGKRNITKIQDFIKQVEEQFDLVLISDYFNESMVLLRRYLNWAMKDIIYIKRNAAKFGVDSVWRRGIVLNATELETFRKWDLVDYKLYEYFKPVFLSTIEREHLFKEEVSAYEDILKEVAKFCLTDAIKQKILHISKSEWTEEFAVTEFDCELMLFGEVKFLSYAKRLQRIRFQHAIRKSVGGKNSKVVGN